MNPGLGPILIGAAGVGIAFLITQLSTGLSNKAALYSALTAVAVGVAIYFPINFFFEQDGRLLTTSIAMLVGVGTAIGASFFFAKVDRGPVVRTAILTSAAMGFLILVDKLMQTWAPYMATDAINYRPIPTIGQVNELLEPGNFWISALDLLIHMFLPTLALTLWFAA